jgi:hypothetical protein
MRAPGQKQTKLDTSDAERLVTKPTAGRYWGLSRRQLDRACKSGEVATYLIGDWPRVRLGDVGRWIEGRRRLGRPLADSSGEGIVK